MGFNDITIDAVEAVFDALSPVTITYKPSGESERDIEALIFYSNEDVEKRVRGRVPTLRIIVRNDSTTGISSGEIGTGLDRVSLPPRKGVTAKWMGMKIVNQNPSFLRLECK